MWKTWNGFDGREEIMTASKFEVVIVFIFLFLLWTMASAETLQSYHIKIFFLQLDRRFKKHHPIFILSGAVVCTYHNSLST